MATTTIDIAGYDNEDIERQFTLRSGTGQSSEPIDITDVEFEIDIRDQRNALVLHLSTDSDGGITKTDPTNGVFVVHVGQGAIPVQQGRSLRYDILMLSGGEIRRLWGGSVRISAGVTVP